MSRVNMNKVAPKPVTKYCKVCHDAGAPESVYQSHYVRESPDPKSKVVCPTLLAQECNYCFKNGHTAGYCPVIKQNEKDKKQQERVAKQGEYKEQQSKAAVKPVNKVSKNVFAAFGSDSDDSEDEKPVKVVEKRVFQSSKKVAPAPVPVSVPIVEQFPALPTANKSTATVTPKVKSSGKSQLINDIEKSCPGLKVAAKTPVLLVYRPQTGKIVHGSAQVAIAAPVAQVYEEEEDEEEEEPHFSLEERLRLLREKNGLASTINWMQDSDDEDW